MRIMRMMATSAFHLLAKPTGAQCNLDCKYCFYLSRESLFPGSDFRMTDETLERYLRQLIAAQPGPEITVAWQGGEPTLMGLDFFDRAVALAERWRRPGTRIVHTLQTNGVLLDDEWAAFLRRHRFLVGLSLDGPRALHDAYRVDKGGHPTFDRVMRGLDRLQAHGVDVNVLTTVHVANAPHPLAVYRFLRDEAAVDFIQLIPVVERAPPALVQIGRGPRVPVSERSVSGAAFGHFLVAIFDEWVRRDVGRVFVQMFEVALAAWLDLPSPVCVFAPTCGRALALEHDGSVYSCDHFVDPEHRLGDLARSSLAELVDAPAQRRFGRDKRATLPAQCLACDVRFACNGGCPKDRLLDTDDGEPGLNWLCEGYRAFFRHVDRPMRAMAALIDRGRPAAEIMSAVARA
jgi:uncharacterized protein